MAVTTISPQVVFRPQPEEFTLPVSKISGAIPADLQGTLLRIGGGLTKVGPDWSNFFDSHGMAAGLTFEGGKARFRSRHVRTEIYQQETKAGRRTVRSVFTNHPSRWKNLFNIKLSSRAAHDIFAWNGKVYATEEPGHYALDGKNLETLGIEQWGGRAKPGHNMSPMPKFDPSTGHLICFVVTPGGLKPDTVTFYEFDGAWQEKARVSAALSKPAALLHEHSFTESYYVVIEPPLKLNMGKVLWGKASLIGSFESMAGATPIVHLIPRKAGAKACSIPMPAGHQLVFHIANAFESGGQVVIDVTGAIEVLDFSSAYPPEMNIPIRPTPHTGLLRLTVDPQKGTIEKKSLHAMVAEEPRINPAYNGKPHRYIYAGTPESLGGEPDPNMVLFYHGTAKVDVETGDAQVWNCGPTAFVSQPVFAARKGGAGEDDGYVLVWLTGETTRVAVLDAKNLRAGPVCELDLGVALPQVSHARFEPTILLD